MATDPKISFTSVMPGFGVADLRRALDFYHGKLGFQTIFQNGPREAPVFAIVKRGEVSLSLATNVAETRHGQGACYFTLKEGIDAFYAELKAADVKMTHDIRDEEYGMREFMVTDPDGNTVNFGQSTE